MKTQPEALRLAEILSGGSDQFNDEAAAELRRLHQSEQEGWRYASELEEERMGQRGQFEKVWVAVPVPDDCPHPKDRVKWGTNFKKSKIQWVILEGAMQ